MNKPFFLSITLKAVLLVFVMTTVSCSSAKNLYQTFFVGDEGIQYFIKPLSFKNAETKEEILVDFTFRHRKEIKDSTIINFDLLTPSTTSDVDKIELQNKLINPSYDQVNLLYKERVQKNYKFRYASNFLLKDVVKLFEANDWKITLYTGDKQTEYIPTKSAQKRIEKLYKEIFAIL
jgi:hypothetical protein